MELVSCVAYGTLEPAMTPTLISLETSTEFCSVAVLAHGCVVARSEHAGQAHSARVLPMLADALREAGVALADCHAVVFGAGPGSFTGLRIACSVAQGLALGAALPVIAVGTLPAMALAARPAPADGETILCALDARMQEAYWATFEADGGAWRPVVLPTLSAPADIAIPGGVLSFGCGNGFDVFNVHLGPLVAAVVPGIRPDAAAMLPLAAAAWARGDAAPAESAAPLYVRDRVAMTADERALQHANRAAGVGAPA